MKTFKQFLEEAKTVTYAGHDYYGSPAKKVLARRSPSSAGGDAGGGGDGGGGGGGALEEGNPLATMHKHQESGRHFIALSTERPGLSKKEVKARNKELVAKAREAGFGVRKAEG